MTGKDIFSGLEDMLFYTITQGVDQIPVSHFIAVRPFSLFFGHILTDQI